MAHACLGDPQFGIERLVGGDQAHPVVDLDRRALEEQFVGPHRILQRDAQPGAGPDAEHDRGFAALQMQVEQGDLGLGGVGQLQGQVDGDAGRAGAALGAADRDDMAAPVEIGAVADQFRPQQVLHRIAGERLRQVFERAHVGDGPVERHVVPLADQRHRQVRRANLGQVLQRQQGGDTAWSVTTECRSVSFSSSRMAS